jgi:hypothetical protein
VPRLCEFYPGICLTTGEKTRRNLSQGKKKLSQVKKNVSHSTVYIVPKTPTHYKTHTNTHITKLTQTHTFSIKDYQKFFFSQNLPHLALYKSLTRLEARKRSIGPPVPSGHYMYQQFNTISTFCPHSVFMCFVWISEQTAIISLYSINGLVCITETECFYCAVWTESLPIIQIDLKCRTSYEILMIG